MRRLKLSSKTAQDYISNVRNKWLSAPAVRAIGDDEDSARGL
jgi:hypothetical protein